MDYFNSHRRLFVTAFLLFGILTLLVAILPALDNQENNQPLPGSEPLSDAAIRGKNVFISNGCVGCHTQQVRSIEMDKVWGDRPGMAADYADNKRVSAWINTATLMGTERTGPDLTNIGIRQPSRDWNLVHLYYPRAVVKESIMPAYPWMFEERQIPGPQEVVVNIPSEFRENSNATKIVAKKEALDLIAYLNALKQVKLPAASTQPFLYRKTDIKETSSKSEELDGKLLYTSNCQSCHQSNGEGLSGAFPALKGSKIVGGDNLELYVDIIMNGYDAREEYGVMPAVGKNAKFTETEIASIINYERSSWGNNAKKVSNQEIKKIMDLVKQKSSK